MLEYDDVLAAAVAILLIGVQMVDPSCDGDKCEGQDKGTRFKHIY
jgi:hypothetical protein